MIPSRRNGTVEIERVDQPVVDVRDIEASTNAIVVDVTQAGVSGVGQGLKGGDRTRGCANLVNLSASFPRWKIVSTVSCRCCDIDVSHAVQRDAENVSQPCFRPRRGGGSVIHRRGVVDVERSASLIFQIDDAHHRVEEIGRVTGRHSHLPGEGAGVGGIPKRRFASAALCRRGNDRADWIDKSAERIRWTVVV